VKFTTIAALAVISGLSLTQTVHAQNYNDRDRYADRYDKNGHYDAYSPLTQLEPSTYVTIRTQQPIDTDRRDGRVFTAVVEEDVWDDYNRLAVPAIRRGSPAELLVRSAPDGDLVLDLDSVTVGGHRYAVSAAPERIDNREVRGTSGQAPAYIGGGALLGSIVGAIAGGGKGAAIGAAAGAAAGAGLMTQGRHVHVPAGTLLTFRLDQSLALGVKDDGFQRGQVHYHR
jgi:hypothetical protein